MSVTAILLENHSIAARPGVKVDCPFCHHRTFGIKRDDQLGMFPSVMWTLQLTFRTLLYSSEAFL